MQIAQRDQNETHIYSVSQDEIFLFLAQYPAPEPGMASGYVSLMYPVDFQPMPTSMPATQIDRIRCAVAGQTADCGGPNQLAVCSTALRVGSGEECGHLVTEGIFK